MKANQESQPSEVRKISRKADFLRRPADAGLWRTSRPVSPFSIPTRYAGPIRTWRSTPILHHSGVAGFEDEDDDENENENENEHERRTPNAKRLVSYVGQGRKGAKVQRRRCELSVESRKERRSKWLKEPKLQSGRKSTTLSVAGKRRTDVKVSSISRIIPGTAREKTYRVSNLQK
jgi:hypothetical protein